MVGTHMAAPVPEKALEMPADVIVQRAAPGQWLLYNVFTRTAVALETDGLAAVDRLVAGLPAGSGSLRLWDCCAFTNDAGLLADPTRILRNRQDWPQPLSLDTDGLRRQLLARFILCDDRAAYRARFTAKTGLLDREHFGNFHQQLGQHLLLGRRTNPDEWWMDQKFSPDRQSLRNNLYRAVQEHFLERQFPLWFKPGQEVIDLGCGIGYFTERIAATGAKALGIDPSPRFLEVARNRPHAAARYAEANIGMAGGLDHIPDASADAVFMSDCLLFYFVAPDGRNPPDLSVLLKDVRRILRPGGRLISVEPHYLFWLAPWLGETDRPFTVFTEYAHKTFGVTGTHFGLIQALTANGFHVIGCAEAEPDPAFAEVDARGYHFAREFPLWQAVEALSPA